MAFIKKDIVEHLEAGKHIRSNAGYIAVLDSGYCVKCSNRSMKALLRDGVVVEKGFNIILVTTDLTKGKN